MSKDHLKMPSLTENHSEKYLKRLAGRTDLEDALRKLDKLTQEEARMAIAQNLRATQNVDERVKGVGDEVKEVNDKVAVLMGGMQIVFSRSPELILVPRWKRGEGSHPTSSRRPRPNETFVIL